MNHHLFIFNNKRNIFEQNLQRNTISTTLVLVLLLAWRRKFWFFSYQLPIPHYPLAILYFLFMAVERLMRYFVSSDTILMLLESQGEICGAIKGF